MDYHNHNGDDSAPHFLTRWHPLGGGGPKGGKDSSKTNIVAKGFPTPLSLSLCIATKPDFIPGELHWQKPSLTGLCLSKLEHCLKDVLDEIPTIAHVLPSFIKLALLAIARCRGLLNDDLLFTLVDGSWEILNVSGSDVTDHGLKHIALRCPLLKAVDISQCDCLTSKAVRALAQHCRRLQILRCGGTTLSDATARKSLDYLLPKLNLNHEVEDSWENFDTEQVGRGAQALRWLVWPSIDELSFSRLALECPIIAVNPTIVPNSLKTLSIPYEALPNMLLDEPFIREMGLPIKLSPQCPSTAVIEVEPSKLECFKLPCSERDGRLASKRAKNMRQNQRRAEKALLKLDSSGKANIWANVASKQLRRFNMLDAPWQVGGPPFLCDHEVSEDDDEPEKN